MLLIDLIQRLLLVVTVDFRQSSGHINGLLGTPAVGESVTRLEHAILGRFIHFLVPCVPLVYEIDGWLLSLGR